MSKVLTYDNPPILCLLRRTALIPGPLPKYPITLTPEQEARLPSLRTCDTAPCAEVQRARLLLLAHHHPSGDPDPSPEDRAFTRLMARAGALLGIRVLDHLIVARRAYFSFAEAQLL